MIIRLNFKTPDVLDSIDHMDIQDEDEKAEILEFVNKYVKWGEYVTLIFDTDKKTVEVAKNES